MIDTPAEFPRFPTDGKVLEDGVYPYFRRRASAAMAQYSNDFSPAAVLLVMGKCAGSAAARERHERVTRDQVIRDIRERKE